MYLPENSPGNSGWELGLYLTDYFPFQSENEYLIYLIFL